MTASKTTELRSYLQVRVSGLESQKGFGQTNLFAGYQPYMSNGGTVPQLASPIPLADVSDTSFDLTGELEAEIDLHSLGTEPACNFHLYLEDRHLNYNQVVVLECLVARRPRETRHGGLDLRSNMLQPLRPHRLRDLIDR